LTLRRIGVKYRGTFRNTWELPPMTDRPPLEFPYGTIERSLATAYGVEDAVRPAGFRGMVNNLQKHGVLGPKSRVGRGAPLTYTPNEFNRLIVAIELCELGVPPATAVSIVGDYWKTLKPIVHAAGRGIGLVPEAPEGADIVLYLGGVGLRTGLLRGEQAPVVPVIDRCTLDELPAAMRKWMTTPNERGLVVNISARLRTFHAALSHASDEQWHCERVAAKVAEQRKAAGEAATASAGPTTDQRDAAE
jgi:hypothetical protein